MQLSSQLRAFFQFHVYFTAFQPERLLDSIHGLNAFKVLLRPIFNEDTICQWPQHQLGKQEACAVYKVRDYDRGRAKKEIK